MKPRKRPNYMDAVLDNVKYWPELMVEDSSNDRSLLCVQDPTAEALGITACMYHHRRGKMYYDWIYHNYLTLSSPAADLDAYRKSSSIGVAHGLLQLTMKRLVLAMHNTTLAQILPRLRSRVRTVYLRMRCTARCILSSVPLTLPLLHVVHFSAYRLRA